MRRAVAEQLTGRCLCGAVRFRARPLAMEMDACHCSLCRRWAGGPWMTVHCEAESLAIEGADAVVTYGSSAHAERAFCRTCGTALYWRMRDRSLLTVSAQAFDEAGRLRFASEIFIDQKPENYGFANETRKMTGAEIRAQFPDLAGSTT